MVQRVAALARLVIRGCVAQVNLLSSPSMKESARKVKILPSLLAGDFGNLAASARQAEAAGGDALHLDIMDGSFVHNISMGPDVVRMARRVVRMPVHVHLMMMRPDHYLEQFIAAGADTLLIHIESAADVPGTLQRIAARGAAPGIVLNPETPVEAVADCLAQVQEVLFMSVHPGFGGQSFMPEVLPKIEAMRRMVRDLAAAQNHGKVIDISVDGGIDLRNVTAVSGAGANVIIAGSSLYKAQDMAAELREMRRKAEKALHG